MSTFHLGETADPAIASIAASEGSFRMGARAFRTACEKRLRDLGLPVTGVIDTPLPDFPAQPASIDTNPWQWWASLDAEWYTLGPCATREEAIERAAGEFEGAEFHLIEAQKHRVTLAADALLDAQYFDDNGLFDYEHTEPDRIGGDQIAAADAELQALLDGWIDRWRHTFMPPSIFAATRNSAVIPATCAAEAAE